MKQLFGIRFGVMCAVGLFMVLTGAALTGLTVIGPAQAKDDGIYRQLNLFGDVLERIRADYVEEVDDPELIEAAITGMLRSLDPHSSYMPPKAYRNMREQIKGEFGGLGIEVTMENGVVKVVSPIDGTPAFRAAFWPTDLAEVTESKNAKPRFLSSAITACMPSASEVKRLPMWLLMPT